MVDSINKLTVVSEVAASIGLQNLLVQHAGPGYQNQNLMRSFPGSSPAQGPCGDGADPDRKNSGGRQPERALFASRWRRKKIFESGCKPMVWEIDQFSRNPISRKNTCSYRTNNSGYPLCGISVTNIKPQFCGMNKSVATGLNTDIRVALEQIIGHPDKYARRFPYPGGERRLLLPILNPKVV